MVSVSIASSRAALRRRSARPFPGGVGSATVAGPLRRSWAASHPRAPTTISARTVITTGHHQPWSVQRVREAALTNGWCGDLSGHPCGTPRCSLPYRSKPPARTRRPPPRSSRPVTPRMARLTAGFGRARGMRASSSRRSRWRLAGSAVPRTVTFVRLCPTRTLTAATPGYSSARRASRAATPWRSIAEPGRSSGSQRTRPGAKASQQSQRPSSSATPAPRRTHGSSNGRVASVCASWARQGLAR